MKIPLQSRKRGSVNERLHLFAKDEKGYPFYQLAYRAGFRHVEALGSSASGAPPSPLNLRILKR